MILRWLPFRTIVHFLQNARAYLAIFLCRDTPLYIKGVIGAAVLYLFSPYDLVPDWLIGFGIIDDIAIVSLLVSFAVKLVNRRKRIIEENREEEK